MFCITYWLPITKFPSSNDLVNEITTVVTTGSHQFWKEVIWSLLPSKGRASTSRHIMLLDHNGFKHYPSEYTGFTRPYHPVMAAHDFNRRQTVVMSFHVILSNTTSLSSFPCEDMRVQGSANVRRMPAMIAHLTWMIYLGQSRACAHHTLQPRMMKLV